MSLAAIVTPTCRPQTYDAFAAAWREQASHHHWIVIEDAPRGTVPGFDDYLSIDEALGDKSWIISRGDSAIRSFGFWLAWKRGFDLIVSLDDDCTPFGGLSLVNGHRNAMGTHQLVTMYLAHQDLQLFPTF